MRNTVPLAVSILVLCLALAPCAHARTQPSSPLSNLQDAKQIAVPASPGIQVPIQQVDEPHRRLLKLSGKAKTSKSKSKKSKKVKWGTKRGKATVLGSVIGVAVVVGTLAFCVVFLTITEKKEQDPKWRVRDLFKRRMKPGVKRSLTRRFTRKKPAGGVGDEEEMEKKEKLAGDGEAAVPDHPPKLQVSST